MVDKYQERQEERVDDLKNLGILAGLGAAVVGTVPALKKGKQLFQLGKKLYQGIGRKVENGALDTPPPKTDISIINDQADFLSKNVKTDELAVLGPNQIAKTFESDPAIARIAKANQESKILNKTIYEQVNQNPLSYGGQLNNPNAERWNQYTPPGGSSFYDFVALHPSGMGRKAKTAIDPNIWVNDIKAGLRGDFGGARYSGSKFNGQKIKLSTDELADANIAIFDKDKKLVGGFLNNAVKANFPVSKETLRRLIENSPAGRTTSRRFGHIMEGPLQDAEDYVDLHDNLITKVRRKLQSPFVEDQIKGFDSLTEQTDLSRTFNNLNRLINGEGYTVFKNDRLKFLEFAQGDPRGHNVFQRTAFNLLKTTDAGTPKDMNYHPAKFLQAVEKFEEKFNVNLLSTAERKNLARLRKTADESLANATKAGAPDNYDAPLDYAKTDHSQYDQYRMLGAERYYEQPVFFTDKDFLNRDGFFDANTLVTGRGANDHFIQYKLGPNLENGEQLYHMRYSMRTKGADDLASTPDENIKVFTIDEIQSDIQQSNRALLQADKNKKRINPVNLGASKNIEKDYLSNQYEKINEMISKQRIGIKQSEMLKINTEIKKFKNALKVPAEVKSLRGSGKFQELNPNAPSRQISELYEKNSRVQIGRDGRGTSNAVENITFQPFFNRQEMANHNVKELINMVANRKYKKDTWVAVNPVERIHALKRNPMIGNYEYYGTAQGKAGFKGGKAMSKIRVEGEGSLLRDFTKDDYNKMAALPKAMKQLAEKYGTEAKTIKIAKSDPKKPYKIIKTIEPEGSTNYNSTFGEGKLPEDDVVSEHLMAFKNEQDAIDYKNLAGSNFGIEKIEADDPSLYYEAYAIKVTPNMKDKNFKLYGYHKGGMVVDIFAW